MSGFNRLLWLLIFLASGTAFAGAIPSGGYLWAGQTVSSGNGKYYIIVQPTDGNFVMYRSDGVVRFSTYSFGAFVAMQTDGNFVHYNSNNEVLWASWTNDPGAWLNVQDDGNLVVYNASTSAALWNIGPDNQANDGPTNVGDVVARDLDAGWLGPLGHLGVWTGNAVAEVTQANPSGNAAQYVSWDSFKNRTVAWPTARPNIPEFYTYECWDYTCYSRSYPGVRMRMAVARRAQQIHNIGADYSYSSSWFSAEPATTSWPAYRGRYRCDTFVIDTFYVPTMKTWYRGYSIPLDWYRRMQDMNTQFATPTSVWNAMKN